MSEPIGVVTVVKAEQRNNANKHAVFARIHVKDEEGNLYYFDAACFNFDLQKEREHCSQLP